MLANDVLLVGCAARFHLLSILLGDFHGLLSRDFQVQHVLALFLFFTELFEQDLSLISLGLELVHQLHLHLSLSLEMLGFLISISDTTALNLVLKLQVVLIHGPLLCEDLLDLGIAHHLLVLEVLNTRLCDRDVNLNKVGLLSGFHGLSLSLLGQLAIIQLPCLHVFLPGHF